MLYICYTIDNESIDLYRPSICSNLVDARHDLVLNFKWGLIFRLQEHLFYESSLKKVFPKDKIKYLENTSLIEESKLRGIPVHQITIFIETYFKEIEWRLKIDSYSIFDPQMDNYSEHGCFKNMRYFKNIEHLSYSAEKKPLYE